MSIETSTIVAAVGAMASIALGLYAGSLAAAWLSRKRYTPENASELLVLGRPEEWNEVRILYPSWTPGLENGSYADASLPGINLRKANLRGCDFAGADLTDADMTNGDLSGCCFRGARLEGVRFDNANLADVDFQDASLSGATFQDAELPAAERDRLAAAAHGIIRLSPGVVMNHPEELERASARELENFVARLFEAEGYSVSRETGRDRGYDLLVTKPDSAGHTEISVVEVKRYRGTRPLGISAVRALYAAKLALDADRAILVTTSRLSPSAAEAAQSAGDIRIVDKAGLLEWALRQARAYKEQAQVA